MDFMEHKLESEFSRLLGSDSVLNPIIEIEGESISVSIYILVLAIIFFVPPFFIVLARHYKWSEKIRIEALLRKLARFEKMKVLMLQNKDLSRRPLNQQLEAYLYSKTNYGFCLDVIQALFSFISCCLVIYSATFPFTIPDPHWAVVIEILLTCYFFLDYWLRFFLATDRLKFYFSAFSLLDFITIVPGLVHMILSESAFDSHAFVVSQSLRAFRIFRVVRLLRFLGNSNTFSLKRQIFIIAITVLSIVFSCASIFQILDSSEQAFTPFLHAFLYMGLTVIGRPLVPTKTDAAKAFEVLAMLVGALIVPAFVAELIRLYLETQGREVYSADPKTPHLIICGDISASRLKTFLVQFYHKSRDTELLCPVVVLHEAKCEGALRSVVDQTRYAGSVKYIRGSPLSVSDLIRAGTHHAASIIVLCSRQQSAAAADKTVTSIALAVKNINRRVRVLAQLRRNRGKEHLECLPGWREGPDRGVAVTALSMTLMGVGSLIPGLPTLLTNLVHQGNKESARYVTWRRHNFATQHHKWGTRAHAAGMIVSSHTPWWAGPASKLMEVTNYVKDTFSTAKKGNGAGKKKSKGIKAEVLDSLFRPMSPVEEYTAGFAQEMFAFAVTPGLANRTFATAARIAYLRYGVLLLGVRVSLNKDDNDGSSSVFRVSLFPEDLVLEVGMYLHALAFDTIDLASLLEGTGGMALAYARADAKHVPSMPVQVSIGLGKQHNISASSDISVPWCFCESEETKAEAVLSVLYNATDGQTLTDLSVQLQKDLNRAQSSEDHDHTVHDYHSDGVYNSDNISISSLMRSQNRIKIHNCTCNTHALWYREQQLKMRAESLAKLTNGFPFADPSAPPTTSNLRPHTSTSSGSSSSTSSPVMGSLRDRPFSSHGGTNASANPALDAKPLSKRPSRMRLASDADDGLGSALHLVQALPNFRRPVSMAGLKPQGLQSAQLPTRPPIAPSRASLDARNATAAQASRFSGLSEDLDRFGDEYDEVEFEDEELEEGGDDGVFESILASGAPTPSIASPLLDAFYSTNVPLPPHLPLPGSVERYGGSRPIAFNRLSGVAIGSSKLAQVDMANMSGSHGPAAATAADVTVSRALVPVGSKKRVLHEKIRYPFVNTPLDVRSVLPYFFHPELQPIKARFGKLAFPQFCPPPKPTLPLSKYSDHILICGANEGIGLLLRSLNTVPLPTPQARTPAYLLAHAISRQVEWMYNQVKRSEAVRMQKDRKKDTDSAPGSPTAESKHITENHILAPILAQSPTKLSFERPKVVVLCPASDRPADAALNAMHQGSSRYVSQVEWISGSPSDMSELLKAGVETARVAIILSNKGPDSSGDSLSIDTDAIIVASAIYKLNPRLHVMTEVLHGPHASYLRPCGTSLVDAEETSSLHWIQNLRQRAKDEIRQTKAKSSKSSSLKPKTLTAPNSTTTTTSSTLPSVLFAGGAAAQAEAQSSQRGLLGDSGSGSVDTSLINADFQGGAPLSGIRDSYRMNTNATGPVSQPLETVQEHSSTHDNSLSSSPTSTAQPSPPTQPPSLVSPERNTSLADIQVQIATPFPDNGDVTPLSPTSNAATLDTMEQRLIARKIRDALANDDTIGRFYSTADEAEKRPYLMTLFEGVVEEPPMSSTATGEPSPEAVSQGTGLDLSSSTSLHTSSGASELHISVASSANAASAGHEVTLTLSGADEDNLHSPRSIDSDLSDGLGTEYSQKKEISNQPFFQDDLYMRQASTGLGAKNLPETIVTGMGTAAISAVTTLAAGGQKAAKTMVQLSTDVASKITEGLGRRPVSTAFGTPPLASSVTKSSGTQSDVSATVARDAAEAPASAADCKAAFPFHVSSAPSDVKPIAVSFAKEKAYTVPDFVGPDPQIKAPSDIFGAPAFAAGRAYAGTTLDALMCEAHFSPHIVMLISQLVRASRKQRLQLIPVSVAIAMCMLVSPPLDVEGNVIVDKNDILNFRPSTASESPLPGSGPTTNGSTVVPVKTLIPTPAPCVAPLTIDNWKLHASRSGTTDDSDEWAVVLPKPKTNGSLSNIKRNKRATNAELATLQEEVTMDSMKHISKTLQAGKRPSVRTTGATEAMLMQILDPERAAYAEYYGSMHNVPICLPEIRTTGELFDGLLRGWRLLPVGLYRRIRPGAQPTPPVVSDPISEFAASFVPGQLLFGQEDSRSGIGRLNDPLRHEKGVVSYVFSNPPPDTVLNYQDYVYVLRPDWDEEE